MELVPNEGGDLMTRDMKKVKLFNLCFTSAFTCKKTRLQESQLPEICGQVWTKENLLLSGEGTSEQTWKQTAHAEFHGTPHEIHSQVSKELRMFAILNYLQKFVGVKLLRTERKPTLLFKKRGSWEITAGQHWLSCWESNRVNLESQTNKKIIVNRQWERMKNIWAVGLIEDMKFSCSKVTSNISQGSIVAPILFSICNN